MAKKLSEVRAKVYSCKFDWFSLSISSKRSQQIPFFLCLSLSLSLFYNLKNQYKKRDIGFQASRLAARQKTYVASNFGTIKRVCFLA